MAFNMRINEYFQQSERMGLPRWFRWVRLAQILVALLILILTAVASGLFVGSSGSVTRLTDLYPGFGFNWFAFAWTVIYLPVAIFYIPTLAARFKPLIILMVLELVTTLWWLVAFALLAQDSRALSYLLGVSGFRSDTSFGAAVGMCQASAVFGAAQFVMFTVCSVYIILAFVRNHKRSSGANEGPFVQVEELPKESLAARGSEPGTNQYA